MNTYCEFCAECFTTMQELHLHTIRVHKECAEGTQLAKENKEELEWEWEYNGVDDGMLEEQPVPGGSKSNATGSIGM